MASLDERARLRADAGAEDAYWALVKELRSYLELLVGLARLDAGPACMAEASAISMRKDVRYLEDAAALVSILSNAEGRGLVSWHLEALARLEPEGRPAFLEETRQAGINPGYPGRRPLCASEQFFSGPEALTLAVEEGGSASFSLRLEFPATNSSASVRPAHADAIRAALKLDELQAAVEALVSGEKDPAASEAFALLGKAQKAMKDALATSRSEELSEGAPREDSARLEGEIAFLDSVFEAIADMPRQGSEKKRFALACIASALVLERGKEGKPSTEAIASILVAAAQGIYEAPGASPSAIPGGAPGSSMAERLRLEYDSRFPGTRQAAQALSALCSLEEAIERDAELDSFFSGGEIGRASCRERV